ncbi:AGCS family alanine or glycine:cation symporter [Paraburkholderia sp. BL27I4N3]|uniref:alanine/glycine:cation symporter family protein n=1 Tax=Paraburkholderia sp. BL27I4N3 TaxID=1938805 RepID=UPI000E2593B5|nr:alanine/glycine:cation symporter family protein [Paraburkholderia sp. BL27I4N3]REE18116.1 AGCS family alanine or glycine:cation symporter [Paraburkholderia sp. BL27I4N3]
MELLTTVNEYLWSPLVFFVLGFGLYLTVKTGCLQIRGLPEMLRLITQRQSGEEGISSFQALALTLSSRVGVGSIAGVATAIAAGGPGALFWMATMAMLGGATAYVESTLAQIYKSKVNGVYSGGIPYYIERGLGLKSLACLAAFAAMCLYALFAPGIQSNNIGLGFKSAFGIPPVYTGSILVCLLAFIIFGRRARLIHFVEYMVPFMAGAYILMAVGIVIANFDRLPGALHLILSSAFGFNAVYGGIVGSAITWGVRRALFANVAGVGEGTFGSAAADVSHPVKQGLVQCFSIYIDTLFVCMATGIMIVITGQYNVMGDSGAPLTVHLPGIEAGPAFAQAAVNSVFHGFGAPFVATSIASFAFTTLIAFYYIAETNLSYLLGGRRKWAVFVLRVVTCVTVLHGAIEPSALIWAIGDFGYASLAWINMFCLVLLAKPALLSLKDFYVQKQAGLDPVFDPVKLGIPNTVCWTHGTDDDALAPPTLLAEPLPVRVGTTTSS